MTKNSEKLTKKFVVGGCHGQFKVPSRYLFRSAKTILVRVACLFTIRISLFASTTKST